VRKIYIFLASSIRDCHEERLEIENFIRNVSDTFEDRYEIKLQPLLCEYFDDAVSEVRKQDEINEKVCGSDFCYFIFCHKAGEYTREEFDVAYEQFQNTNKPKIYTYFRKVADSETEEDLRTFKQMLEENVGHYYGEFSHIDTVKLRILLNLKLAEMDFLEIKTDLGSCWVDGKPVLPLTHVAEFANNQNLRRLQEELQQTETEYLDLKPKYVKGGCSEEECLRYAKAAARREALLEEIHTLEDLIFGVSLRSTEDSLHGEMTLRQKKAYRLFEQGDFKGCRAVLDPDEMQRDFLQERERLKAKETVRCRTFIREQKTLIAILSAMTDDLSRFENINALYEKLRPYVFGQEIEFDTMMDYVVFLLEQQQEEKALALAQQLRDSNCSDAIRANCSDLIGHSHLAKGDKEQAYYNLMDALGRRMSLYASDPKRYRYDLANSYDSMRRYYVMLDVKPERAETYLLESIRLNKELTAEDPAHTISLVNAYNDAGNFYLAQNRLQEADKYFKNVIQLLDKMREADFQRNRSDAAGCFMNAASFYAKLGQRKTERHHGEKAKKYIMKADRYYQTAFMLYRSLAAENPITNEPKLALCCLSYACDFNFNSAAHLKEAVAIAKKYPKDRLCQTILRIVEEAWRDTAKG